ncbi:MULTISPECIES: inovirus-type Gp2 protein [unclassified Serratia (in: enterobacteria)]|uniref:inovirus-type Gp2 protein n=1 Tax=unclassified Serratia (in: enterobacteria) TaxID=2647522 RepID=UPI0004681E15|nr:MULTISPECIES: inovirus-type Gp2 protein [unclassified Serratia (in: enterobacteria)]
MKKYYQKRVYIDEYDVHLQLATSLLHTQEFGSETVLATKDYDTLGNIRARLQALQYLLQDASMTTFSPRGLLNPVDTLRYALRLSTPGQAALLAEQRPLYRVLHPTLDRFIQTAKRCHDSYQRNHEGCPIYHQDAAEQTRWLEHVLDNFRKNIETVSPLCQVQQFLMKNEPHRQKARRVVNALLRQYKSLMMVGIDLSYVQTVKDDITPMQIRQHRRQLLALLHNHSHFRHCAGYAWKLEHGPIKGFCYQLVCFFNAAQVDLYARIGVDIGTCWQTVTEKAGRSFCQRDLQDDYSYPGLMMFYQTDTAAPEKLYRILDNMIQTDTYARLTLPHHFRTSGSARVLQ